MSALWQLIRYAFCTAREQVLGSTACSRDRYLSSLALSVELAFNAR